MHSRSITLSLKACTYIYYYLYIKTNFTNVGGPLPTASFEKIKKKVNYIVFLGLPRI